MHAYDDAINASKSITFNGGRVYAYAVNNDGIDSNGTLTVNGGLVISNGSSAPEESFDCDRTENFKVNGGTLIGISGAAISPSSSSSQKTVIYNGLQFTKDKYLSILASDGNPIAVYRMPRTINGSLIYSSSSLKENETYTLSSATSISGTSDNWNGWIASGSLSEASQLGTFTINGTVTTIGTSFGPGGGAGGPGGWGRP